MPGQRYRADGIRGRLADLAEAVYGLHPTDSRKRSKGEVCRSLSDPILHMAEGALTQARGELDAWLGAIETEKGKRHGNGVRSTTGPDTDSLSTGPRASNP
jgi:hypothetical protein